MHPILDMIGFIGGLCALIAIALVFTGRLTIRNFNKGSQWF